MYLTLFSIYSTSKQCSVDSVPVILFVIFFDSSLFPSFLSSSSIFFLLDIVYNLTLTDSLFCLSHNGGRSYARTAACPQVGGTVDRQTAEHPRFLCKDALDRPSFGLETASQCHDYGHGRRRRQRQHDHVLPLPARDQGQPPCVRTGCPNHTAAQQRSR